MKTFNKILVANRGEIAIRVMRTCKDMGIISVAVYSEIDRDAPHVLMADEAYLLGPAAASASYLDMDKILAIARQCKADAIHPGYGFLAENAQFSQKVADAGMSFIGPSAATISLMGSKTESRQTMITANVPVVPGAKKAIATVAEARDLIADTGGYPILIKAAAGGGGKGMRIVNKEGELERALAAARSEAKKAFGDDTVYLEKYIQAPKHIEMQIICDQHGNFLHLWERDCSIQRRHQKVIEECPSATITAETRQQMGAVAKLAAEACDYVNAGTIEFLLDEDGSFYFLEMNTRLQVEHPVTEEVIGVDLVRMQIEVAMGKAFSLTQAQIQPRGHAIECRINAEDVFNGFVPFTGKIERFQAPQGPGVRLDAAVRSGLSITRYYDPMLGKLICWGEDREQAINRMLRALSETVVDGLKTTIPFCQRVLSHPVFRDGSFTTRFVEQYWEGLSQQPLEDEDLLVILAALAANKLADKSFPNAGTNQQPVISPWKQRQFER